MNEIIYEEIGILENDEWKGKKRIKWNMNDDLVVSDVIVK